MLNVIAGVRHRYFWTGFALGEQKQRNTHVSQRRNGSMRSVPYCLGNPGHLGCASRKTRSSHGREFYTTWLITVASCSIYAEEALDYAPLRGIRKPYGWEYHGGAKKTIGVLPNILMPNNFSVVKRRDEAKNFLSQWGIDVRLTEQKSIPKVKKLCCIITRLT